MLERQSNQGTADWLRDRAGHATASCFADILAVSKRDGKPLKARDDYLMRIVVERITGEPVESASSFAMNWGTDAEPYARAEYEIQTGNMVREAGFVKHPKFPWIGASSDGLVGDKGGIEIKCPYNSAVHLDTWRHGMPEHHLAQVQGQMWILGLDWIDFCSFDPRMQNGAEHLKLYRQRIARNDKYIDDLESAVLQFLAEAQVEVSAFLALKESTTSPAEQIMRPTEVSADANLLPAKPSAAASTPCIPPNAMPSLRLGQIGERLGFSVTADFLRTLGFEPAGREKSAVLFHESQFEHICAALVRHIQMVCQPQSA